MPQDVALAQVPDLVREHGLEFPIVLRQLHQFVGHHDDARGQRQRIGAEAAAAAQFEPDAARAAFVQVDAGRHARKELAQGVLSLGRQLARREHEPVQRRERIASDQRFGGRGQGEGNLRGERRNAPDDRRPGCGERDRQGGERVTQPALPAMQQSRQQGRCGLRLRREH